jgi:hypothetical protein
MIMIENVRKESDTTNQPVTNGSVSMERILLPIYSTFNDDGMADSDK